uniref:Uncharacterized protein n=1 Tax=Nelumbo nucifera TaxID=4432 RepID=A0A822Y580_NELNU|nr:TPA_asm: hypothetical protein HUJ06_029168 [Nelumbo nucifera]
MFDHVQVLKSINHGRSFSKRWVLPFWILELCYSPADSQEILLSRIRVPYPFLLKAVQ